MNKLSRKEGIAVGVALIATFGILFFGNYIFGNGSQNTKNQQDVSTQSATVENSNVQTDADGVTVADVSIGKGEEVKIGDTVSVHYIGTLINGTKFDSSYDRNAPISFTLGDGQLIKGFDDGVTGMKVGGKRRITIPPDLAYGDKDVGPIPANSTLVFDVELVSIEQ